VFEGFLVPAFFFVGDWVITDGINDGTTEGLLDGNTEGFAKGIIDGKLEGSGECLEDGKLEGSEESRDQETWDHSVSN